MSIARYNMWARITAPSGILVELNKVTSAHVDHVAKTSGTLYFTFVHLYGLGSPMYNVTYTIYPSTDGGVTPPPPSPPPPVTTPPVTPPASSADSPTWGWIIVGFIVLGIFFAFAAARGRIRRKRDYDEDYEGRGAPSREIHHYFHQPRRITCPDCEGTGKEKMMIIQRGGPGMRPKKCSRCKGTGFLD